MNIIEDTRQKVGKHDIKAKWWASNGDVVVRCKLPFGDYITAPGIAVDTKENMAEIAGNMCGTTKEHIRFREECKLARDLGSKLVFLIENEDGIKSIEDVKSWVNPRAFVSKTAVDGSRLSKAMSTMRERYGCDFMFCTPQESADKVCKILAEGNE